MIQNVLFTLMALCAAGSVQAVPAVTWDPTAMPITADSNVNTEGTLVEARNLRAGLSGSGTPGTANPVINGVQFVDEFSDTLPLSTTVNTTDFSIAATDGLAIDEIIKSFNWQAEGLFSFGHGLLIPGNQYLVQFFYADGRSSYSGRTMGLNNAAGGSNPSPSMLAGTGGYVIGRFTADAPNIVLFGDHIGGTTFHLSAYQIRQLTSGPAPTLSTTAGNPVSGNFTVNIDFTEAATGLAESDILVVNGTVMASSLSGSGTSWSVVIIPTVNGSVSVRLPANCVKDGDNHQNPESNTLVMTYVSPGGDQPIPTLSISGAVATTGYTVQINFTEAVTGLGLGDFLISNGTLSGLAGSGASYSVLVTPIGGGTVTLSLPGGSVTDIDGDNLQNPASNVLVTTFKKAFVHPGISHKTSDLERIKYMVGAQIDPWYASYQEMAADSKASYNYTVQGKETFTVLGRDDGTNYGAWNSDIRAAYYNAIRWYVTGDSRHAEKAIEIFNAWRNLTSVTSGGTDALSGGVGYIMIEAAEIIKSTYSGWSTSEIDDFKNMLVYPGYSTTAAPTGNKTFYWMSYQGDPGRHGNQGLSGWRTVMAMGIFLDNEIMYNRALRYIQGLPHRSEDLAYPSGPSTHVSLLSSTEYADTWSNSKGSSIQDYGYNEVMTYYLWANGQCQESSRDQAHAFFAIGILCSMAEMAWNQGDDLYSHANNRLLLGLEYTMRYNVSYLYSYPDQTTHWVPTVESGEFIQQFDRTHRWYSKAISPDAIGNYDSSKRPIFEIPVAHYIDRGFKNPDEAKWTLRARDTSITMAGYETAGWTNDALGWGALVFRRPAGCAGDPISGFSSGLPDYAMNVIPCTIEAENYDYSPVSGQGRIYLDATSGNSGGHYRTNENVDIEVCSEGGYNLTSMEDGEWIGYTIYVPSSGNYNLRVRYAAANSSGKIKFTFNGSNVTGDVVLPATGGLTNWTSYTVNSSILLTKGVQNMRVYISGASNSYKLNNITIDRRIDAFSTIQAEAYSAQSGVQTEACSEGGQNVGYIQNGDRCAYYEVDFGSGAGGFQARVASSTSGGNIEIRLDSAAGMLLGTCSVTNTGGNQNWVTKTIGISGIRGIRNVYLVFTGSGTGYLFNVNWFTFTPSIDGDLTFDEKVNMEDVAKLSAGWQSGYTMDDLLDIANNWLSGVARFALRFDGIDDSVAIPGYKGILGTQSRTCAAWIKTPGMASNTVILNWGAAASGQQWIFGLFSTGELAVYAGGPYIKTTALVNDNQWHHVAAALTDDGSPDVSEIKLYIDGVLQTTANTPGAVNTVGSYDVLMGAFWNGSSPGGFFKGLLDDVRIYSRPLTAAEIGAIENISEGLAAYWNLNEGSGNTVQDVVSGYTGTIYGSQWTAEE